MKESREVNVRGEVDPGQSPAQTSWQYLSCICWHFVFLHFLVPLELHTRVGEEEWLVCQQKLAVNMPGEGQKATKY
jgi:hypothetical protein